MMCSINLLQDIVVRIYLDDKTCLGTGFFLKDDLVITCYHVLEEKDGSLRKCYYIKHDLTRLIAAEPIRSFRPPIDIAILHCQEKSSRPINVVIKAWDNQGEDNFLTRGYDINTPLNEGASTEEGKIVDLSTLDGERRLQLRTELETLLQGRSGSPVLSERLRALVGMIDYRSGKESNSRERSYAIPLEMLNQLGIEIHPKCQIFYVPSLPLNFIPRSADLEKAKAAILSEDGRNTAIIGTYRSVGLQGMGGIGKSVLAVALARDEQVRRAFKDGIIWIGLRQQADLLQSQLKLIRALEPAHGPIADIEEGRNELERILCDKCCMIILDDVWRMEQLQAFDGLGPGCRMLLTTRNQAIIRNSGATECRLGVMTDEEALTLLKMWSGKKDLPPQALEVARECENLPLALAMVGAMVKGRPDDRWENILHKLRSADLEKIQAEFRDYPYPNLMKAIEISTESLEADQRKLYLDLAVFPEDEQVPEGALQVLWNLNRYDIQDLIDLFVDRSLAILKDGRLSVHDLQHDFMIKRSGDLLLLHEKLLEAYKKRCSYGWPSGPNDGYFFQHLAYHLAQAGRMEELRDLVFDFRWIEAKLARTDITTLISDFGFIPNDEEARFCRDALMLSAHVLFEDKCQLAGQLLGRLQDQSFGIISHLVKQAAEWKDRPWLRPITASLTPPGGPLVRTLQGHTGQVTAVSLTPDGQRAISSSGTWDSTLRVWDLATGRVIMMLQGHTDRVRAINLTPDGQRVISGSRDGKLKVWDLATGREIMTLQGHTGPVRAVSLTPDGKRAISGSSDRSLRVWDLATGREIMMLQGHMSPVRAVSLTPDGQRVISGSKDGKLKVWDLATGQEIRTLQGHAYSVNTVCLTSDGRHMVSGSRDSILKVWDLATVEEIMALKGHTRSINTVCLTPDGKHAVSGSDDNTLKIWDLETGENIGTLLGHAGPINTVCLTPDGQRVVTASSDRSIKVWDLAIGQQNRAKQGHAYPAFAICLMPDGQHVVSGLKDGKLSVLDLATGREIRTLQGHMSPVKAISLTPDGQHVVSGSSDRSLKVWDLATGQEIKTLLGHAGGIRAVSLTPDGQRIVSGSSDKSLKVWDLATGREIMMLQGHTRAVRAVSLTPDGQRAISGSNDSTLKIWDLATGRMIKTLRGHAYSVNTVCLTPDGQRAISGSNDNTLKIWDLATGRMIKTLQGHTGPVTAVCMTPSGQCAVSGSYDNTLKVWDLETGKILLAFTGEGLISAVAVSSDGRTIIASDTSGRVHFLQIENFNA